MKLETPASFAIYAKTVTNLKNTEQNLKKWDFGYLTKA